MLRLRCGCRLRHRIVSPVFAALTTKRTLHVYFAPTNQIRGPWEMLQCVNDHPSRPEGNIAVSSFTWLDDVMGKSRQQVLWLLSAGVDGKFLLWRIKRDGDQFDVALDSALDAFEQPISSLECSKRFADGRCLVAAASGIGVQVFSITDGSSHARIRLMKKQPKCDPSLSITWLAWFDETLIFCAPGEVYGFDAVEGAQWSVILDSSDKENSFPLQPPVNVQQVDEETWDVTLQDGFVYKVSRPPRQAELAAGYNICTPYSEMEAPIEMLVEQQRAVEKLRGMYARKQDGLGLEFVCLDTNDIAAWSYILNRKCQLDLALVRRPNGIGDVDRASDIVRRILEGKMYSSDDDIARAAEVRNKSRRSLLVLYGESNKKGPILRACFDLIEEALMAPVDPDLASAMQITCWLKTEIGSQQAAKMEVNTQQQDMRNRIDALVARVNKLTSENALYRQVAQLSDILAQYSHRLETRTEVQARLLVVWSLVSSCPSFKEDPKQEPAWGVARRIGWKESDVKFVREWIRGLKANKELDVGEMCPACDTPVTIGAKSMVDAKCMSGHPWRRCAVTHAILTEVQALCCVICARQAILPSDGRGEMQKALLEAAQRCPVCAGSWVVI